MAKLVQKSGYIKSGKAGGYMRYIATREGVEKLAGNGAVTKGQRELIQKLLTDFPDAVELFEYEDYCKTPTLGTASAFITMALDANLHEIDSESGYMQYIATRPRVQKRGTHGLFSSATAVDLASAMSELEAHEGNVWTIIYSLRREDAARLESKALGNRTVLSGSVSRGKNDPSQSLQMMERPLLTPDELKSIPKGNFIVQKTGQHPMRTRLRLFLEWGITFEEPYIVPERADRAVAYANREDLERNLPQSSKAENADMRGAYAVSGSGGIAHEPAVDKPRRRGGKQMKTYGEEDL